MGGGGSDIGSFAAASCPRDCKRPRLRPLGRSSVRDLSRIRRPESLGPHSPRRSDALHGSAYHLRKAHRRLGESISCRTGTHVSLLPPHAAHGVRFSGLAGPYPGEVERDFRTCPVGEIRDDRDRHVSFQLVAWEAVSRIGRDPLARGGSQVNR